MLYLTLNNFSTNIFPGSTETLWFQRLTNSWAAATREEDLPISAKSTVYATRAKLHNWDELAVAFAEGFVQPICV